jgi:cell division protein FtsL
MSEKLQQKTVKLTNEIERIKEEKKARNQGYNDLIKDLEKRRRLIAKAASSGNHDELMANFGPNYAEELGLE